MKLFIVTFKQGKHQGEFFDEWDYLKIVSVLARNDQDAIQIAADKLGLNNKTGIEVDVL